MKKLYRFLGSLKLAIFWLIFLGFLVILGAVVPQGPEKQIHEGSLPDVLKSLLIFIQAYDAYHSPLFLISIGAFFLTLLIATKEKIWPIFKTVFKTTKSPDNRVLLRFPTKLEIKGADFNQAKNVISKKYYKLIKEQESYLHFERGKWSKTSSMIAHISLFLILTGVIIGILTSFKGTVALVPSENASVEYIISKAETKGKFVNASNDNWSVKVNKFWMDFHPNGSIKQYFSDLSVIDNSNSQELLRKTIYVNEPLVYNGIYFYQASWGVSHLAVVIDGKKQNIILQPLKNEQGNVSDKIKLGKNQNEYVFFLDQKNQAFVFDLQAQPVAELNKDNMADINGSKVTLKEIVLFTGLQVKKDLGIPIVYVGFILIILALIINFFSYNQLWLIKESERYYLIGKATRANYLMEQEINKIADLIEIDKNVLLKNTTHV